MKLNLAGVPDRPPLDLSKHFKVASDRVPKDEVCPEGAHLENRASRDMGDWHEMDWYRRNVYLKKAK